MAGIDLNINIGTSKWSFFVVSAEVYGNKPFVEYHTIIYWPPPIDTLTRSQIQTNNAIWNLGPS